MAATKQCRARLVMPDRIAQSEMVFTCARASHEDNTHAERGRVRTKDNRVLTYTITWEEAEPEIWRTNAR